MLVVLSLALVALLALNAFFVLAEFAIVKVRPSRVAELAAGGDPRAALLAEIHGELDEYLSVCQVGITFASVALGMVGERMAHIVMGGGESPLRYAFAIAFSYVVISGSHILLGELVPKSIAIRVADRSALRSARPLKFFHLLFFPALWVLTKGSNAILSAFGLEATGKGELFSEDELRLLLEQSQERGMMSFRRLLFMENVFDLGELSVRDAMRRRSQVRTLDANLPWAENLALIKSSHFTRYPLITDRPDRPAGFVHIKDLVMRGDLVSPDLRAMARPLITTSETTPLESLFADMQRRRIHAAIVTNAQGEWTGFLTLEDLVEELVGTIRDEFEDEEPVRLADALALANVHFGIEADSPLGAVAAALARMKVEDLPLPAPQLLRAIEGRERLAGTYLGQGIGLPHARIAGLPRPFVMVLRSEGGVRCEGTTEKAQLLFVLLTPAGQPRVHQRLQSIIATLLNESVYVKERLMNAVGAEEVIEALRTGEQAALD